MRVRFRNSLFLLFTMSVAGLCAAQEKEPIHVKVGDPIVDGAILKPYKNLWRMSIVAKDGKTIPDMGTWSDELDVVKNEGRESFRRTQIANFVRDGQPLGNTKTVNVFDPKTLAPISRSFEKHAAQGGDSTVKIEFRADLVEIVKTENGQTSTQEIPRDTAAYDFYGGLYGIIVTAFPLEKGFSATFPSFGEEDIRTEPVTFKVTGSEFADAGPRGKIQAWVVEAATTLGPMKFWLSREAPYIIRLEYTAQANGAKWIYTML